MRTQHLWEFCDSRRQKVSFFSLTVFLLPEGLSLGILTGFQGQASPPLLSGNTGTALLSCQTGLDTGPHSPQTVATPFPPQVKFYVLLNSWERVFKSILTCSCSSHMHTFCSRLGFIFSLGSAKPHMNVIARWNVPWSLRTRLKSPANTCLSFTLIHRKDVHI